MINRIKLGSTSKREHLITTFGLGRLIRLADGALELRGGQAPDQTAAKEWISLFAHETVLRFDTLQKN
jgi:hypothetical protein